jgi:transcription elongation factor GreB
LSRAFVSEQDSTFDQDVPEIKIPLPEGSKNYVTPAGGNRLQEELAALDREERPRLVAAIARLVREGAADLDDLNRARWRLREVVRRIEYLNRMIARMEIVEPGLESGEAGGPGESGDQQRVQFGVPVAVGVAGGGTRVFRIVGVDESDPGAGLISWISPLARALTGARRGEQVEVELPEGRSVLEVLAVGREAGRCIGGQALEKKPPGN